MAEPTEGRVVEYGRTVHGEEMAYIRGAVHYSDLSRSIFDVRGISRGKRECAYHLVAGLQHIKSNIDSWIEEANKEARGQV